MSLVGLNAEKLAFNFTYDVQIAVIILSNTVKYLRRRLRGTCCLAPRSNSAQMTSIAGSCNFSDRAGICFDDDETSVTYNNPSGVVRRPTTTSGTASGLPDTATFHIWPSIRSETYRVSPTTSSPVGAGNSAANTISTESSESENPNTRFLPCSATTTSPA